MSPEQARGKSVDKRADIWAFGGVLYEMLTGRRLFAGETVSDTLAAVLTARARLGRRCLPPRRRGVRRLLARCLEKDAKQRLRDIGDARARAGRSARALDRAEAPPASALGRALPWGLAAAMALVACWALWGRSGNAAAAPDVIRFDIALPPDVEPLGSTPGSIALSPDGRTVAMIGVKDGARRLFVRRLDRAEAVEVPDTNGANHRHVLARQRQRRDRSGDRSITCVTLADQQRTVVASGPDLTGSLAWSTAGIVFGRARRAVDRRS